MDILQAIEQRHCVRAYLDKAPDHQVVRQILDVARWAPSGANIQPWQVAVVTGKTRRQIGEAIIAAREDRQAEKPDYPYYPAEWRKPYKQRRRECGLALYKAQDIGRHDEQKRLEAWYRNYRFFDAPVGLIFYIDDIMQTGSWLDMGMFLQNIMLAARHFGLATCPQASLAEYPDLIREILGLEADKLILCGMALGYEDPDAPVNQYRLPREDVDSFTHWYE